MKHPAYTTKNQTYHLVRCLFGVILLLGIASGQLIDKNETNQSERYNTARSSSMSLTPGDNASPDGLTHTGKWKKNIDSKNVNSKRDNLGNRVEDSDVSLITKPNDIRVFGNASNISILSKSPDIKTLSSVSVEKKGQTPSTSWNILDSSKSYRRIKGSGIVDNSHQVQNISQSNNPQTSRVSNVRLVNSENEDIHKSRPKRNILDRFFHLAGANLPRGHYQIEDNSFSEYVCPFSSKKDYADRKVYWGNSPSTIRILVSQRPESRLLASLLRLVLRDYLGYRLSEIVNMNDRFNTSDTIEYLTDWDSVSKVTRPPQAMIQLDMLASPQFILDESEVLDRRIVTLGDTGPTVRLGWYMFQTSKNSLCNCLMTDHWRLFQYPNFHSALNYSIEELEYISVFREQRRPDRDTCNYDDCTSGIFVPSWCRGMSCPVLLATFPDSMQYLIKQIKVLKLTVQVHFVGDYLVDIVRHRRKSLRPVLFVHYTPSLLLLDEEYDEVAFPSNLPSHCGHNNALYLHKLAWSGLKTSGALVYKIVRLFRLTQNNYMSLLRTQLKNPSMSYEQVACKWMTEGDHDWRDKWIPVDKSENIIQIGGIFPISEKQLNSAGILTAANMAFNAINSNESLLPGFTLAMKLGDGQCSPDMAIKNFIRFIQTDTFRHMAGIIGPACSNAVESIAGVARHYRTMVISYSAEGAVLSNRTRYPYFFRTIGENRQFRFVYKQLFERLGWKRLGALTESGQKYSEYITSVQDVLEAAGVKVIFNRRMHPLTIALPRYLKDIQSKDVRIIIADLYESDTKNIMCQAFKNNMTAKQGYVWFLPAWFTRGWYEVTDDDHDIPCSTEDMSKALEGHLALSHSYFGNDSDMTKEGISVKQWRQYYSGNCSQLYQMGSKLFLRQCARVSFTCQDASLAIIATETKHTPTKHAVSMSPYEESNYAGYAYDAVWTYGLALDKLLREERSHYRNFHSAKTTARLFELLSATDFRGVSGHIRFRGPSRLSVTDVKQWVQGGYTKVGHFIPDTRSIEGGRLYLEESKFKWLTPDGKSPHDGLLYDCDLRGLAELLDVTCDTAIIMVNVVSFTFVIMAMVFAGMLIRRRYENKVRRLQQLGLTSKSLFSLDQWEMAREKVVLNRKLGEGAFGMVYGGEAKINVSSNTGSVESANKLESTDEQYSKTSSRQQLIAVAVKTLKRHCTIEERLDFLAEADVMKKFKHENIVRLLGVCSRSEPILTVMEFMLYGDLKTFLLARRTLVSSECQELKESSCEVSSFRLTAMASDVASALNYLANNNFVHRDVACRNCLVGSRYVVKLADFGMTRSLCDNDYYRFYRKGKLPVRWMAPESVRDGRFTPKSDVWSFGVLLYEIVTFGSLPYQGHSNDQVVELVRSGRNVGFPDGIKQELRDLMSSCWNIDECKRPDCSQIVNFLRVRYPRLICPCLGVTTPAVTLESFDFIEEQDLSSTSVSRHIFPEVHFNNGINHLGKVNQGADKLSDLA